MKLKLNTLLFITSFIPVITFKVAARVGEASLAQAKLATAIGLVLAAIQFILSKRFLNHTTYLERAFLGFLGAGAAWVYLLPSHLSFLFVQHSTTLLYLVLFLTTFVPQLLGYDPFTYAIAKQWVSGDGLEDPPIQDDQPPYHLCLELPFLPFGPLELARSGKARILHHHAAPPPVRSRTSFFEKIS